MRRRLQLSKLHLNGQEKRGRGVKREGVGRRQKPGAREGIHGRRGVWRLVRELMEDVECVDRPEGGPRGGRREVGGVVLTIVEQTRKRTWFRTLRWMWLGGVPGDGGVLEAKIDR